MKTAVQADVVLTTSCSQDDRKWSISLGVSLAYMRPQSRLPPVMYFIQYDPTYSKKATVPKSATHFGSHFL